MEPYVGSTRVDTSVRIPPFYVPRYSYSWWMRVTVDWGRVLFEFCYCYFTYLLKFRQEQKRDGEPTINVHGAKILDTDKLELKC